MRNGQLEAFRVIVATLASLLLVAVAQTVDASRQATYDLPQTDLDREVLTHFFGAIDGVQGPCNAILIGSLATERAMAACATFSPCSRDLCRQSAQLAFKANFG